MIGWEAAITFLLTLDLALLGVGLQIVRGALKCMKEAQRHSADEHMEFRKELALKVGVEDCENGRVRCFGNISQSLRDLWDAWNKHSHEGLPPESRVIRG